MKIVIKQLILLLFFVSFGLQASPQFDKIYVFGDSLSDNGNLASIVGPLPNPPYFGSARASNGLVALEVMASRFGLTLEPSLHLIGPAQGTNYAVIAAKVGRNEPQDLATQVALFLANHGGAAPENALYVMFIGGNDIRHARDSGNRAFAQQYLTDAANTIATQIQVLNLAGAKNWLVVQAPDLGRIPETQLIANAFGLPGLPAQTTELTEYFNDALHQQVDNIEEANDIEIEEFKLFKKFNKIIDKAAKFGFSNTSEPCFSSEQGIYTPGCNFGFNIDQYIFFDEIHPTARIHAIIGEMMYRQVRDEDDEQKEGSDKDD
ncbi:MAG: SGNH/GDSL hydrolase family protein [Gammaproteobacteria bacterium]|nr:SGNH/GDSL hydrolase family protein [Gammaproteobacteria bacterium]MDH5777177.1 SGNH/GDSL hydrolase family protein [Gammaproteobacteria bacterium]